MGFFLIRHKDTSAALPVPYSLAQMNREVRGMEHTRMVSVLKQTELEEKGFCRGEALPTAMN